MNGTNSLDRICDALRVLANRVVKISTGSTVEGHLLLLCVECVAECSLCSEEVSTFAHLFLFFQLEKLGQAEWDLQVGYIVSGPKLI